MKNKVKINSKFEYRNTKQLPRMSIGVGLFPANTLIPLQRLQSLASGFGTFAYAKYRASSPHDGLLQESPAQMPSMTYLGYAIFYANSNVQNLKRRKCAFVWNIRYLNFDIV